MTVQFTEPVAATREELLAGLEALNGEDPQADIGFRDDRRVDVGGVPEFPPAAVGRPC